MYFALLLYARKICNKEKKKNKTSKIKSYICVYYVFFKTLCMRPACVPLVALLSVMLVIYNKVFATSSSQNLNLYLPIYNIKFCKYAYVFHICDNILCSCVVCSLKIVIFVYQNIVIV